MDKLMCLAVFLPVAIFTGCNSKPAPSQFVDYSQVETIDGVYIPKDLEDCFIELGKLMSPDDMADFKSKSEDDLHQYHRGMGMWIRNNWGLWKGSRLSLWFRDQGAQHPDDISSMIISAYYRHLNGKPIGLEKEIAWYQAYWRKQAQENH